MIFFSNTYRYHILYNHFHLFPCPRDCRATHSRYKYGMYVMHLFIIIIIIRERAIVNRSCCSYQLGDQI